MQIPPLQSPPVHIRHSHLLGSLSDDEVQEILSVCRPQTLRSGDVVCRQGDDGDSMFVIVSGRVSIDVATPTGSNKLLNYLGPGDHFGEISLLVGGKRSANVRAVMTTEVLELTRRDFERSITKVPGFAANLSRSLGEWLRGQITGGQRLERRQVALVRGSHVATGLASQIASLALTEGGELDVLSDQPARHAVPDWKCHEAGDKLETELLRSISFAADHGRRFLVDIDRSLASAAVLLQHELVWWVTGSDADSIADASLAISELLKEAPQLASRIQLVVALEQSDTLPRVFEPSVELTQRPMRVEYIGRGREAWFTARDVTRLTRAMRGIELGIALGGGGARGIAHIGVLEVCEREGIFFDRVAGTSAGAIVASGYAAGIPLDRLLEIFTREMTPPRALRWIPKSPQWYMLAVFRLAMAEPKFRRYLANYTFEQLLLPAQLISVDLVSGEHRIRQSGDVVQSVLESINHPVFGKPILRDGEALVDGGVLMNLPVTALRQQKVDYSVAVDVSKQLSKSFGGNSAETPTEKMRRPGYFNTLLRVTDVELKNLATLHSAECDFLIAPDTAEFPFDDFTQGEGLVEAGRQAAEKVMPQLKKSIDEAIGWQTSAPATPATSPVHRRAA